MKILLAVVLSKRALASGPAATMLQDYLTRSARYLPCEHRVFASEAKLLDFLDDATARTRPQLIAADSSGELISSEGLADAVTRALDAGTQTLVFAIGPADGWSPAALRRADRAVAFGRITLPHELAAVVAAEQIYRALTIRAGHPYHNGH